MSFDKDMRFQCIAIAEQLYRNRKECFYSEDTDSSSPTYRWGWKNYPNPHFPFHSDCSGTVTAICYWSNCVDPNGTNFEYGNTATILNHAKSTGLIIPREKLIHGHFVLFGGGDTPVHVVMSMQNISIHPDPICFSMGQQGDPSFVKLSVLEGLGEPTFVYNHTMAR